MALPEEAMAEAFGAAWYSINKAKFTVLLAGVAPTARAPFSS
jgi:hypothetical protein